MRGQDHQIAGLFDGTPIPASHRGRVSKPLVLNSSGRWVIAVLCALLFGVATAATAITIRRNIHTAQATYNDQRLPTNSSLRQFGVGVEDAVY